MSRGIRTEVFRNINHSRKFLKRREQKGGGQEGSKFALLSWLWKDSGQETKDKNKQLPPLHSAQHKKKSLFQLHYVSHFIITDPWSDLGTRRLSGDFLSDHHLQSNATFKHLEWAAGWVLLWRDLMQPTFCFFAFVMYHYFTTYWDLISTRKQCHRLISMWSKTRRT